MSTDRADSPTLRGALRRLLHGRERPLADLYDPSAPPSKIVTALEQLEGSRVTLRYVRPDGRRAEAVVPARLLATTTGETGAERDARYQLMRLAVAEQLGETPGDGWRLLGPARHAGDGERRPSRARA